MSRGSCTFDDAKHLTSSVSHPTNWNFALVVAVFLIFAFSRWHGDWTGNCDERLLSLAQSQQSVHIQSHTSQQQQQQRQQHQHQHQQQQQQQRQLVISSHVSLI